MISHSLYRLTVTLIIFLVICLHNVNAKPIDDVGFQVTNRILSGDWIQYNSDGSKVVIVRTRSISKRLPTGAVLEIYKTDSKYQPEQRLFIDNQADRHFLDIQWVGNNCIYFTVEGFQTMQQIWDWLDNPEKLSLDSMAKHTKLTIWPLLSSSPGALQDVRDVHFFPPGAMLASQENSNLLVFNPLSEWKKYFNPRTGEMDDQILNQCGLYLYNLLKGQLVSAARTNIPSPATRWWSKRGDFIPLYLTANGNKLIAIISSNKSRNIKARNNVPFVVSIDTKQGDIIKISPDSWISSLSLFGSVRHFAPGNPMILNGGKSVVFNLSQSETINDLVMRFGIFTFSGEKIEEIRVFEKDLKRAGVPNGQPIAWTSDGKRALIQSKRDIWLLNYKNWTGKLIAKDILVEEVIGWLPKGLHVKIRRLNVNNKTNTGVSDSIWGIIFLPEENI